MKRSLSSIMSILSGAFLIVYAFPYLMGGGEMLLRGGENDYFVESLLMLIGSSAMMVTGALMFYGNKKYAAVAMTVSAPFYIAVFFLGYPWTLDYEAAFGTLHSPAPWYCVLYPVLVSLAVVLHAAALYFRGRKALIFAIASAAAEIAGTVFHFKLMDHMVGHPSGFALLIPAAFVIAALFTGVFSCIGNRGSPAEKTE